MLTITAIPAFNDNYIWVLQQDSVPYVYVVDPGDASVVTDYLELHGLTLAGILLTHHHADHTGGVPALVEYAKQTGAAPLKVYGPHNESIVGLNVPLDPTTTAHCLLPYLPHPVQLLSLPGHTAGHIAYVIEDNVFCGDTLFSAGCGRVFEGSPAQMHQALSRLATLPNHTKVYCAHEYTLANLQFALRVDPDNCALHAYAKQVAALREQGRASIPSTIALELTINPFLRTDKSEIVNSIKQHFNMQDTQHLDELTCFTLLRQWKNIF
ncbi:MAG: hydroxyacylglutathione hydrolase [Shewanella sp.]